MKKCIVNHRVDLVLQFTCTTVRTCIHLRVAFVTRRVFWNVRKVELLAYRNPCHWTQYVPPHFQTNIVRFPHHESVCAFFCVTICNCIRGPVVVLRQGDCKPARIVCKHPRLVECTSNCCTTTPYLQIMCFFNIRVTKLSREIILSKNESRI